MQEQLNTLAGPVVVGVDQSPAARVAVRRAAAIAAESGRALHLVHAVGKRAVVEVAGVGSDRYTVDLQRAAEDMLNALERELSCTSPITTAAVVGPTARALCDEARLVEASLIVLGRDRATGRFSLRRSIADQVSRQAPCEVEVVETHQDPRPLTVRFA